MKQMLLSRIVEPPAKARPTLSGKDKERVKPHRVKILDAMRVHREMSSTDLTKLTSHRFSARIKELRRAGHDIQKRDGGGGLWWYWLVE